MKSIRKILLKFIGLKGYLSVVSSIYIQLINAGFYKKKYAELHFINKIIEKNSVVVDIGANLGYYSYFLGKKVRKEGKLIAIEPIPLFASVWKKNLRHVITENVTLENCALGESNKEIVKMSIPIVNGVVRHGLTKIDEKGEVNTAAETFDVPMRVGDDLLDGYLLGRLDFIKCDVEGYEQFVIPSLNKNIEQFKPMIQIELNGEENRRNVVEYLVNLGYEIFILNRDFLNPIRKSDIFSVNQDFYFLHSENTESRNYLNHK